MNYEVKKTQVTGSVQSNTDGTFKQLINVTVGVVGCPYEDIKTEKTIEYVFAGTLSAIDAQKGIAPFVQKWLDDNYKSGN